jgi:hypothetical protein
MTQNDEMCNFYTMFYVNGNELPKSLDDCWSVGPPQWNWNAFYGLDRSAAPESASIIPGTMYIAYEGAGNCMVRGIGCTLHDGIRSLLDV